MRTVKGNWSTWRITTPVPIYSPQIPHDLHQYQLDCCRYRRSWVCCSVFVVFVFHDHSITTSPSTSLCVLSTPSCISTWQLTLPRGRDVTPFDDLVYNDNEASQNICLRIFPTCCSLNSDIVESLCANFYLTRVLQMIYGKPSLIRSD
jgi:hypothetical protein